MHDHLSERGMQMSTFSIFKLNSFFPNALKSLAQIKPLQVYPSLNMTTKYTLCIPHRMAPTERPLQDSAVWHTWDQHIIKSNKRHFSACHWGSFRYTSAEYYTLGGKAKTLLVYTCFKQYLCDDNSKNVLEQDIHTECWIEELWAVYYNMSIVKAFLCFIDHIKV